MNHELTWVFQELSGREYEYLPLTRDTTEADIKQRREIKQGNAFYVDLVGMTSSLEFEMQECLKKWFSVCCESGGGRSSFSVGRN